jgi:GSH-dependent disulfide-bond oxidoreductase
LEDFPHLKRWFETIRSRPATVRAYDKAKQINTQPVVTEESKRDPIRADSGCGLMPG